MRNNASSAASFASQDNLSDGERKVLRAVIESPLEFSEELRVSRRSVYGDCIWSWIDNSNLRLALNKDSYLSIKWDHFKSLYNLTSEIIKDLKKYAFLRLNYSKLVFPITNKNGQPKLVISEVRIISAFLLHLRSQISVGKVSLINRLSDIKVQDIRDCFESYSAAKNPALKAVLINFASKALWMHFGLQEPKWNVHDIATLRWEKKDRVSHERLPDKLFSLLSNSAIADVKEFLEALQIEMHDEFPVPKESNLFSQDIRDFRESFENYVQYLNDKKAIFSSAQLPALIRKANASVREAARAAERASLAARIIMMLYTGARGSELVSFRPNSLRRKDETWVIMGTVIKHKNLNSPVGRDEWVAIPIVRDAVQVLEQTGRAFSSEFLFHPCIGHKFLPQGKPVERTGLNQEIKKYINLIDSDKEWEDVSPVPHQFRNSLAFELRKASIGLPFIAYQLKHVYSAIEKTVNDVTLSYGSLSSSAVHKAVIDANLVALKELYHPDSPIAGGGAEQHKRRRAAYFEGMVNRGFSIDEVLLQLALEGGMPLTDVGLGYCQGQMKIVVDGVKADPPCIGSLRCNPVRCQNAVIPEHKLPVWKKSLEENMARLEDPAFAYARPHLQEAIDEIRSVTDLLQIQS